MIFSDPPETFPEQLDLAREIIDRAYKRAKG